MHRHVCGVNFLLFISLITVVLSIIHVVVRLTFSVDLQVAILNCRKFVVHFKQLCYLHHFFLEICGTYY